MTKHVPGSGGRDESREFDYARLEFTGRGDDPHLIRAGAIRRTACSQAGLLSGTRPASPGQPETDRRSSPRKPERRTLQSRPRLSAILLLSSRSGYSSAPRWDASRLAGHEAVDL